MASNFDVEAPQRSQVLGSATHNPHLLAVESEIATGDDADNLLSLASQTAITDHATPFLSISPYESNESSAMADITLLTVNEPIESSSSKISTPSILIDNYESGKPVTVASTVHSESVLQETMTMQKGVVLSYDTISSYFYSPVISDDDTVNKKMDTNHLKGVGSEREVEVDTCELETTRHHSRLLRLLSSNNETGTIGAAAVLSPNTESVDLSETATAITPGGDEVFPPPPPPGVRLRMRSRRARDRIPSRVFRSLQQDFDSSSTEETHCQEYQEISPSLDCPSLITQRGVGGPLNSSNQQNVFRFSHLFASLTPETPSSANSEMEGFFLPGHRTHSVVFQHQNGN